jgi:disulfide bond formation protein DsbB
MNHDRGELVLNKSFNLPLSQHTLLIVTRTVLCTGRSRDLKLLGEVSKPITSSLIAHICSPLILVFDC